MTASTRSLRYRILNVFTEGDDPFSGNPLCVFEDAEGLSDADMQNLARQLNLSETTFITPGAADVSANVRIFTASYEMPFAGHPTLGTAYVVRDLSSAEDLVVLRMPAGDIPVRVTDNVWTLQANPPMSYPVDVAHSDLTAMIGLTADHLAAEPLWVDTGTIQLMLPLRSAKDVRAASADPKLLDKF
ncbi:MAG TPA: PhzF family phenazine biosynthesis protein, partial [Dermatophilaceae bacterium]